MYRATDGIQLRPVLPAGAWPDGPPAQVLARVADSLAQLRSEALDEDEAAAQAASPGPWHVSAESDEVLAADGITVADGFALSGRQLRATTEHIARHDPARVLREVEAKRAILGWADSPALPGYERGYVIGALAAVYRDHPDYDPAWTPGR
jgi:hypothetical protein